MRVVTLDWQTPHGVQSLKTEEHGRGGSESPRLLLVHWNGKRITPYEQKKLRMYLTFMWLLKHHYSGPMLEGLILSSNPLFSKMPKDSFGGGNLPIPLP